MFAVLYGIGITHARMHELLGVAILLNVVMVARIFLKGQLIRSLEHRAPTDRAGAPVDSKGFAKWARTNTMVGLIYRFAANKVVPAACALAMVFLLTAAINRVAFDLQSGNGQYCHPALSDTDVKNSPVKATAAATSSFATNQLCWSTGRALAEKTRYRIIVDDAKGNWFDQATPTDPKGFTASNMLYLIATPFKRWWREPWFAPVARVGATGNREYPLQPCIYRSDGKSATATSGLTAYADPISEQEATRIQKELANKRDKERQVLVAEFTPETSGELFLFVNDAVVAIPRHADFFYKNNRGTASVTIEQIHQNQDPKYHYYCPK